MVILFDSFVELLVVVVFEVEVVGLQNLEENVKQSILDHQTCYYVDQTVLVQEVYFGTENVDQRVDKRSVEKLRSYVLYHQRTQFVGLGLVAFVDVELLQGPVQQSVDGESDHRQDVDEELLKNGHLPSLPRTED